MKLQYIGSVILLEALWTRSRMATESREHWISRLRRLMRGVSSVDGD